MVFFDRFNNGGRFQAKKSFFLIFVSCNEIVSKSVEKFGQKGGRTVYIYFGNVMGCCGKEVSQDGAGVTIYRDENDDLVFKGRCVGVE